MHDVISLLTFVSDRTTQKFVSVLKQMQLEFKIINGQNWLSSPPYGQECAVLALVDQSIVSSKCLLAQLTEQESGRFLSLYSEEALSICVKLTENVELINQPFDDNGLPQSIFASLQKHFQHGKRFETSPVSSFMRGTMIGKSQAFESSMQMIEKVAKTDISVYVFGETGTGKEITARAIHYLSGRRDGPFIPVNCGALSEELMLSELFGHEKGAFTGANKSHVGLLEQANHGTVFLDEVDSLSQKAQVTLLRYLQEKEFRTVGGSQLKHSDSRILVASNKPLDKLVLENKFRMDLLFRLDVLRVNMPPLRDRDFDVYFLTQYFLDKLYKTSGLRKTFDKDTIEWMLQYSWPGNIRELDNFVQRAYLLSDGDIIHVSFNHSMGTLADKTNSSLVKCTGNIQAEKEKVLRAFELQYLSSVLTKFRGNITRAAKFSGKERSCFSKLMKKHGLVREYFVCKSQ